MTGYNPATDADKPITAGVLFTILQQFAQDMLSPRSEIIEALGYTPADAADLGEANGIATLGADGKLASAQIPSIQTVAGYTPSNSADEGVANGIATLGSDAKLSTSQIPSIQTIAGYTPADSADIGAANGIAGLDSSGKVPASQLPSYVDDVIEVASYSNLPVNAESGKIYVALDTGRTYRWSGSAYVEISNYTEATGSSSGLMSATDKTKLDGIASGAQVNSVTGVKGNSESSYRTGNVNITPANIGAAATGDAIKNISRSGTTFTATRADGTSFTFDQQDNNTTYSAATQSAAGLMSAADKTKLDKTTSGVFTGNSSATPGENDIIWIVVDQGAQMTADV